MKLHLLTHRLYVFVLLLSLGFTFYHVTYEHYDVGPGSNLQKTVNCEDCSFHKNLTTLTSFIAYYPQLTPETHFLSGLWDFVSPGFDTLCCIRGPPHSV